MHEGAHHILRLFDWEECCAAGEKNTLILSGVTFLTIALVLEGSFLLRFSLAILCSGAVLVWRAFQDNTTDLQPDPVLLAD
jgi:hypothetical protein